MSELSETDPRLKAAASAAEILGTIQGTVVNGDATLTAVIDAHRGRYFIVDFFPNGDLMAIMEIQGTDIQRHPDSSMLNAVVKEQIRYNSAKEALVDTFSARIPLTVVDGADQGGCCAVEGGCCGGAAQAETSEDDDEDHHSDFLGIILLAGGEFRVTGLGADEDDSKDLIIIEAEPERGYEVTMSFPSGTALELELEWDGEETYLVSGPEGVSYFTVAEDEICMAGTLTEDGLLWAPLSRDWIEE